MKNVNKETFVIALRENHALTKKEAENVYETFVKVMRDNLTQGNRVLFRGLFSVTPTYQHWANIPARDFRLKVKTHLKELPPSVIETLKARQKVKNS